MALRTICAIVGSALLLAGCEGGANISAPDDAWPRDAATAAPWGTATSAPAGQPRDDLPTDASLGDYLGYAALHNPGLAAAFNRWKAALQRVPQVRALPDPRFTYRYYIKEVETRVGPQRNSVQLAQTFPWLGTLSLRGDAAAAHARAERQRFEQAKLTLFHQVKAAYHEYYHLGQAIAITEENVKLLALLESVIRARYRAAVASHPDLIRLQVEQGKLADRLRDLRDLRDPIVARLNAAMNRPAGAPLGSFPTAIAQPAVTISDDQMLALQAQMSPQLKALEAEIAGRRAAVELARKAYFPNVTLGLTYIDTARATGGRNPDGDGRDPLIAMVSVNLPIWRDKLDAGVREARRRLTAQRRKRTDTANNLAAELKMTLYQFRQAGRRAELYRDSLVPRVTQSFHATRKAYAAGKAGFSDFVDTQRTLLEFQLIYQRALTDRATALAKLERLVGQEIPHEIPVDRNEPAAPNVQSGETE